MPPEAQAFVEAVEEAYHQFDSERTMLEHSLELTSDELVEHNQRLQDELGRVQRMQGALERELRERKRVEEALRRSLVRLDEAQRIAAVGYWEWRLRTGEVLWSDETFRIYGYEPGSVEPSQELFVSHTHPDDLAQLTRHVRLSRPGRSRREEYRIHRVTGEVRTIQISSQIGLDEEGHPTHIFGIMRDVTDEREHEQTLIRAREQAEEAQRHAEELLALKTTLLDNISHELRTPLAAIIGFAEILAADLDGERQEFAQLIAQSGERLLDTFNSVLTLATLESGTQTLDVKECELVAEAREAVRLLEQQVEARGLYLRLDAPEDVAVHADVPALHRVLHNLIGNALKFTAQGGVTVRIGRALHEDGRAYGVVAVEDTGRGIDPAFLPRLFDAFQQESKGMARTHEGAGLGLTIVRRLAEMMQGWVEAESVVGVGSTFRVYLPCASASPLRLVPRHTEEHPG